MGFFASVNVWRENSGGTRIRAARGHGRREDSGGASIQAARGHERRGLRSTRAPSTTANQINREVPPPGSPRSMIPVPTTKHRVPGSPRPIFSVRRRSLSFLFPGSPSFHIFRPGQSTLLPVSSFPWFPRFQPGCDLGSIVRVSIAAKLRGGISTKGTADLLGYAGDLSRC